MTVLRLLLLGAIGTSLALAEENKVTYEPLSEEAKAVSLLAMAAYEKGDLAEARLQFEKMRAVSSGHPMAMINLGTIEFRTGRFEQSAAWLEKAVQADPKSADAWMLLGMVRVHQDLPDLALAALAQAQVLAPKNPKIHNYLGVAIGRKRWFDGAESELQLAISLDPEYGDAHFNLALILLQRDPPNLALARRHYQIAIKLGAVPDPLMEKKLAP